MKFQSTAPLEIMMLDFITRKFCIELMKFNKMNLQLSSYRLHPRRLLRMEDAFNKTSNKLITIRDSHFLIVNSMTMARDGCYFCENAEMDLLEIAAQLNCAKKKSENACRYVTEKLPFYSRPILLQHFQITCIRCHLH